MISTYWPLAGLRLATDEVMLRPMIEDDVGPLADLLPEDVDQNPIFASYAGRDGRSARGTTLHQTYWHTLGTWRPESWNLPLTVFVDGMPVGVQTLEADDFAARRTVDSSSWLTTAARGRGIGKRMRLAVLTLAFDGLGATVAETSAWHDNAASLGVSRSLGYVDNGVYMHADRGRVDEMRRMRLTRAAWSQHRHADVHIEGLPACLPFFGVG
ncbi:MAG TPA: GNAT family protein [Micromonosporaceae bacterium]|nr:GNAT family protein [Micromonosporaceae bacterium]